MGITLQFQYALELFGEHLSPTSLIFMISKPLSRTGSLPAGCLRQTHVEARKHAPSI